MNLSSGWEDKDSTLARIQEILSGARIELVRKGFECGEIARDAVRRAARAVVAAGGDGTVRAVGEALAGTGVPLGVIPAGTFNHFARDLGVPLDIEAAAAALIGSGRIAQADAGEVNGRVFVNQRHPGVLSGFAAGAGAGGTARGGRSDRGCRRGPDHLSPQPPCSCMCAWTGARSSEGRPSS